MKNIQGNSEIYFVRIPRKMQSRWKCFSQSPCRENAFPVKRILFHFNPANLIYELHKFYALKGKGINDPEREIIQILLSDWQPLNSWNGNIFTFSLLSVSGKIKLPKFLPKFNAALLRIPCMESKLFKQIIGIFKTF